MHELDSQPHSDIDKPLRHYVIIRDDLPAGLAAAQIVHAAGESVPRHTVVLPGTHAVVLACSPDTLVELHRTLTDEGYAPHAVYESDAPYEGQLMALGFAPKTGHSLKKRLRSLQLYC